MNLEEHALKERLANIKMLVMDVDGTMTDGSMYYSKEGDVAKRFYVRDGMGVQLVQAANIRTVIITSEATLIVEPRAKKLGIHHVIVGCKNKSSALKDLVRKEGIELRQVAYIGDDINDEAAMRLVGVACAPSDAHPIILEIAHLVLPSPGGRGAIRDLCDHILIAQGLPITYKEH
jgi:YrbI family 3-deoxy-D-manno-octulosonate 8-phosphate phosphatase